MEKLNFNALAKKAFRSLFRDGIYVAFLGILLLSLSLLLILNVFGWIDYKTMTLPLLISIVSNISTLVFFVIAI